MSTSKVRIFLRFILSFTLTYSAMTSCKELEYDWENLSLVNVEEIRRRELYKSKRSDYKHLLLAKRGLINGELNITNNYLAKIDDGDTAILPIKIRYQAIVIL